MKAFVVTALTSALLVFGAGSALAMEQDKDGGNAPEICNFGQFLQKHEDLTVAEARVQYEEHHNTLGAKPSKNFECEMMMEK